MSIWGNVILPQKDGFVYGANEPGVPCLWFNTAGTEIPADPDVSHGMLLYRDADDVLHPLYPMTTMASVYGLNEAITGLESETEKKLSEKIINRTVLLPASGWTDNAQTVTAEGVTVGNTILVGYSPESFEAYSDAGIRCTEQGSGTLTFVCESTPDVDVSANVVILN